MFSQEQLERFVAQGHIEKLDPTIKYHSEHRRKKVMLVEPDIINITKILEVLLFICIILFRLTKCLKLKLL